MSTGVVCAICRDGFSPTESLVNANGIHWHQKCFVCVQCFQPFPEGLFFEHEGRKYCQQDYESLFAPVCSGCGQFIIGRLFTHKLSKWHPTCFTCYMCGTELNSGFVKYQGQPTCKPCAAKARAESDSKYLCARCNHIIDTEHLTFKGEPYHPHHFDCFDCHRPLTHKAKELHSHLFCQPCYDTKEISVCGACKKPIEGRAVSAVNKKWHPEHFVCAHCERPFAGERFYEHSGMAYCELHYKKLYGDPCFYCCHSITNTEVTQFSKSYCEHHFLCLGCDAQLKVGNTKFLELDMRPLCKKCYSKLPDEYKKRLKKYSDMQDKRVKERKEKK